MRARIEHETTQLCLGSWRTKDLGHYGTDPEGLLDHGFEVVVVLAHPDLGDQTFQCGRSAQQPLERPADRGGRRLVTGQQDRDQLVSELAVGQRVAIVVTRGQQHAEDVAARVMIGTPPATLDLLIKQGVDVITQADETTPWTERAEILLH